jgi:hypothetical protein
MHDFDGETLESRLTRRRVNWMPAVIDRLVAAPSSQSR